MKIKRRRRIHAAYIYLSPDPEVRSTKEFNGPHGAVLLDFDHDGFVVGVEVLG